MLAHLVVFQVHQSVEEIVTDVTSPVPLPQLVHCNTVQFRSDCSSFMQCYLVVLQLSWSLEGSVTNIAGQLLLVWRGGDSQNCTMGIGMTMKI